MVTNITVIYKLQWILNVCFLLNVANCQSTWRTDTRTDSPRFTTLKHNIGDSTVDLDGFNIKQVTRSRTRTNRRRHVSSRVIAIGDTSSEETRAPGRHEQSSLAPKYGTGPCNSSDCTWVKATEYAPFWFRVLVCGIWDGSSFTLCDLLIAIVC